ncbi:hypothetical protein [Massilia sp. TN1-12]|uniref:hypothetical protein n=1 Tax=Massilia paldalensis TaxID=3377675 RepID=UPI0038506913
MNRITGNSTAQSAGSGLTPQQRALLSYFGEMTESAQGFLVEMAAHNARVFPRQRPKLRVVAGGAA